MNNWRKYHGALIPSTPPHIQVDITGLEEEIKNQNAYFARWISDFDQKDESEFWYVICDTKMQLQDYSRNTRSKISRSKKYFDIRKITKRILIQKGFKVYKKAQTRYKSVLFPKTKQIFINELVDLDMHWDFWGVFIKETDTLVAYSINKLSSKSCDYSTTKFDPSYLSKYSSYLLYHTMNEYYLNIKEFNYIHNGTRSLSHQTNIQSFLMQKFLFRKAYCTLNVVYSRKMSILVKYIYPFHWIFSKLPFNFFRKVSVLLKQEHINRLCISLRKRENNHSLLILSNGNFKSGSTWVTAIIKEMLHDNGTIFPKDFQNPKHKNWINRYKIEKFLKSESFYRKKFWISKTHIFDRGLINLIHNNEMIRVINIDREIKDVLVSHYFHLKNSGKIKYDFGTYFNKWGKYKAIQVQNYNNAWDNSSSLKLNYENLKLDKIKSIHKISEFLEIEDIDTDKIIRETDLTKLREKSKQKDLNEEEWFFRKGEIGDWKNYFNEEMLEDLQCIEKGEISHHDRINFFFKFVFRLKIKYFFYRYIPRLYLIFDKRF
jgi:hypothetical protein